MRAALALAAALALTASSTEAPEWKVELRPLDPATPGKPTRLEVELLAREGFHINPEYPLSFRAGDSEGASAAKPRFDRGDGLVLEPCASEPKFNCRARLPILFTAERAARVEVRGTLAFSVCDPNRCLIQKVPLAVALLAPRPP